MYLEHRVDKALVITTGGYVAGLGSICIVHIRDVDFVGATLMATAVDLFSILILD